MTTYTAFVGALSGMAVSGVTRRYTAPPAALSTADLPASYPLLPSGEEVRLVMGGAGGVGGDQSTLSLDLVFAVEPVGQGTGPQNFAACLALVDAIAAASRGLTRPTRGPCTFTLRLGIVQVGGVDYWAIVESWSGVG